MSRLTRQKLNCFDKVAQNRDIMQKIRSYVIEDKPSTASFTQVCKKWREVYYSRIAPYTDCRDVRKHLLKHGYINALILLTTTSSHLFDVQDLSQLCCSELPKPQILAFLEKCSVMRKIRPDVEAVLKLCGPKENTTPFSLREFADCRIDNYPVYLLFSILSLGVPSCKETQLITAIRELPNFYSFKLMRKLMNNGCSGFTFMLPRVKVLAFHFDDYARFEHKNPKDFEALCRHYSTNGTNRKYAKPVGYASCEGEDFDQDEDTSLHLLDLPDDYIEMYILHGLNTPDFYPRLFKKCARKHLLNLLLILIDKQLIDPLSSDRYNFCKMECCRNCSIFNLSTHPGFEPLYDVISALPKFDPTTRFSYVIHAIRHKRKDLCLSFIRQRKFSADVLHDLDCFMGGVYYIHYEKNGRLRHEIHQEISERKTRLKTAALKRSKKRAKLNE
jgi:hypothetical protein